MRNQRASVVFIVIAGLLAGGCQSGSLPGTVVEYRPSSPEMKTTTAADSGVFVLWRWVPVAPVASGDATAPANPQGDRPVEVKEVYAERGAPIGFRLSAGRLLAVGGTDSVPLEDSRYTWTARTALEKEEDARNDARNFMFQWWFWTSLPAFAWIAWMCMGHPDGSVQP
jgi:hypothetical protein